MHDQLRRNGVEILTGTAAFADPHTLEIDDREARATASRPSAS